METISVEGSAKETMDKVRDISGDVCLVVGDDAGTLNVFDLLAIRNSIKQRGHVVVELRGVACPLIAMGAARVLMERRSMLIVKAPWMMIVGNSGDATEAVDVLDKTKDAMKDCYASRPQVDRAAVFAMLDDGEEHFLDAEEAKLLGLVDELTD